jgi:hypothetical protein
LENITQILIFKREFLVTLFKERFLEFSNLLALVIDKKVQTKKSATNYLPNVSKVLAFLDAVSNCPRAFPTN